MIETSSEAKIISSTNYILQTYVYSIENYLCHASTLNTVCTHAVSVQSSFNFEKILEDYSKIIYPVLLWSLLLEKKGCNISRKDITKSMVHDRNPEFAILLQNIRVKADKKVTQFELDYPAYIPEISLLKKDLEKRGLVPENAYLFVVGHALEDFIVKSIIEPVRVLLFTQHIQYIKSMSTIDEDKENKINHFKNKQVSVKSLISRNFNYKNKCNIYSNLLKPSIDSLMQEIQAGVSR